MPILTFDQQQQIKPISTNNESKYSQLEIEVEEVELKKLLGVALLQDIQAANVPFSSGSAGLIEYTFDDSNLVANVYTANHNKETNLIDPIVYDGNGDLQDITGMFMIVSDNLVTIDLPDYTDLLNGSTFTNSKGQEVFQKGLRYIIAYFVYSKYLGESFVADTFSGFVQKQRDDSNRLTDGQLRTLQERNREIALTEWELIKEYLDLNKETYTLWDCTEYKKLFTPIIKGVRRTKYGG